MDSEQSSASGIMIGIVAIIAIIAITLFAVRMIQSKDQENTDKNIFPIINLDGNDNRAPSSY